MNSRASLAILSSRTPDDVVCKILFQYPAAGVFRFFASIHAHSTQHVGS